jgi:hypothetical protein
MKILELMHSLEEGYDRFGDTEVKIEISKQISKGTYRSDIYDIKDTTIESEEFIINCEDK